MKYITLLLKCESISKVLYLRSTIDQIIQFKIASLILISTFHIMQGKCDTLIKITRFNLIMARLNSKTCKCLIMDEELRPANKAYSQLQYLISWWNKAS